MGQQVARYTLDIRSGLIAGRKIRLLQPEGTMRRFLAIPYLFILPLLLVGCGEQDVSCGELEKRMVESSKTLQEDLLKAARAQTSGDTKTVCQTTSSILSNFQPMFKAATSCKSISSAISLNKLIRTMEGMRREQVLIGWVRAAFRTSFEFPIRW
jgi:hypothetical protein